MEYYMMEYYTTSEKYNEDKIYLYILIQFRELYA